MYTFSTNGVYSSGSLSPPPRPSAPTPDVPAVHVIQVHYRRAALPPRLTSGQQHGELAQHLLVQGLGRGGGGGVRGTSTAPPYTGLVCRWVGGRHGSESRGGRVRSRRNVCWAGVMSRSKVALSRRHMALSYWLGPPSSLPLLVPCTTQVPCPVSGAQVPCPTHCEIYCRQARHACAHGLVPCGIKGGNLGHPEGRPALRHPLLLLLLRLLPRRTHGAFVAVSSTSGEDAPPLGPLCTVPKNTSARGGVSGWARACRDRARRQSLMRARTGERNPGRVRGIRGDHRRQHSHMHGEETHLERMSPCM